MKKTMRLFPRFFAAVLLTACCAGVIGNAQAAVDSALLKPLAGDDPDARIAAVARIAALANADAKKILDALNTDTLFATPPATS